MSKLMGNLSIFPPSTRISGFIIGVKKRIVSNKTRKMIVKPQMMVTEKKKIVESNAFNNCIIYLFHPSLYGL